MSIAQSLFEKSGNPTRIPPQTPPAGGRIQSRFCQIQIPRKIVWQNRVRIEDPPPARRIEGRVPQKNALILLEEKIRPSPNQKSGEHFLRDTRAERAVVGLIHSFNDFENRCELGKIETPIQNLTVFRRPNCGRRKAPPTDFPPHFSKRIRSVAFGDAHCFSGEEEVRIRSNFDS